MHSVTLNITSEIFEKFMGLIDILPKNSIKIEKIDSIPFYPPISFDEAKQKVENSLNNIHNGMGRDSSTVFSELLS